MKTPIPVVAVHAKSFRPGLEISPEVAVHFRHLMATDPDYFKRYTRAMGEAKSTEDKAKALANLQFAIEATKAAIAG